MNSLKSNKLLKIANFQESSIESLDNKGIFDLMINTYNPTNNYIVHHFSPFKTDLRYKEKLQKKNILINYYNCQGLQPLKFISSLKKVISIIKKENLELIRCRNPYLGSLLGCLAGKILKIPTVVSLGGNNRLSQELNQKYLYNSKFFSYNIERLVLNLCDIIITPNNYTKKYVEGIIGRKKINKCTNLPWINYLPNLPPNKKKGKNETILIVGFLNKYKFTDVLYNVIEKLMLSKDFNNVSVIFCGDGPLMNQGKKRFKKNVKFYGWCNRKKILDLIDNSTLILIPMSGNVIIEAAYMGKPVISSNLEWHSEVIKHMKSGLLVDPKNENEWINSIKLIMKNKKLSNKLGTTLQKIYFKSFDYKVVIKKELRLYQKTIENYG